MPDQRRIARGVIDTSVVIDMEHLDPLDLPVELAMTSITMAELAAGPHAATDPVERARRQDRVQRAEAAFDPIPFDGEGGPGLWTHPGGGDRIRPEGPGTASRGPAHRRGGLSFPPAAVYPKPRGLPRPRGAGRDRAGVMVASAQGGDGLPGWVLPVGDEVVTDLAVKPSMWAHGS
jgi:hypothetical protein